MRLLVFGSIDFILQKIYNKAVFFLLFGIILIGLKQDYIFI